MVGEDEGGPRAVEVDVGDGCAWGGGRGVRGGGQRTRGGTRCHEVGVGGGQRGGETAGGATREAPFVMFGTPCLGNLPGVV